jgi:hypothetical protein
VYTVTLTNGLKNATNTAQLTNVLPSIPHTSLACKDAANTSITVEASPLPAGLAPNASIVCTFAVAVTDTHAQAGQIPAFTVSAVLTTSPADLAFTIEDITVPSVPVSTGATLAVSAGVPQPTTSLSGETLSATKLLSQLMYIPVRLLHELLMQGPLCFLLCRA